MPVEIGAIQKMSKSLKNLVDPDDIIDSFGADTARLFMLSDSPPERDVIWSEDGVHGARRYVQQLWWLIGDLANAGTGAVAEPGGAMGSGRTARHGRVAKAGNGGRPGTPDCQGTGGGPCA